jgi:hypothetical protein
LIKLKRNIPLFFKDIFLKLEIISSYMDVLRKKGNSLPIKICIKINIENKIPKVEYF